MRRKIFRSMALTNIRNNRKFYLPYMLTIILTAAMFFEMSSISRNPEYLENSGVKEILGFGVVVIGIFALIFLFYTNSFLMKRRKKELGLYYILGLEKSHICRILIWETLISSVLSITAGILTGLLFDRLMFMILLKLFRYPVSISYHMQPEAIKLTLAVFACIFLLILFSDIHQLRKNSAIELLKSENLGEKEPKAKWIFVLAGVFFLGLGYYLAITTDNIMTALSNFLFAVISVIIGTYLLFMAGSIAVLKMLKRKKAFYYKTNHFVSVSGLIYRMKQNAVGLANICILSTGVLLVLSTTVCLYSGMKDILNSRFPSVIRASTDADEYDAESINAGMEALKQEFFDTAEQCGTELENFSVYKKLEVTYLITDSGFSADRDGSFSYSDLAAVNFITADTYQALTGETVELTGNEVAVNTRKGKKMDSFELMGETYQVVEELDDFPIGSEYAQLTAGMYHIVVSSDETLKTIFENQKEGYRIYSPMNMTIQCDISGDEAEAMAYYEQLRENVVRDGYDTYLSCRYASRDEAYMLYGSMLFLGVFLGSLFLMATVLIIYYKQVMEGYEDRDNYVIMKKVGMDRREIRRCIRSQILILFFLPLGTALLHCAAAFPLMLRILQGFYMYNWKLFLTVTVITAAVFTAAYVLVYAATAKSYYRIVSD